MKTFLIRSAVVILGVLIVSATFAATEALAQCQPRVQGAPGSCFQTNHVCLDYCQGMDCIRGGTCYLGLVCVTKVCASDGESSCIPLSDSEVANKQ